MISRALYTSFKMFWEVFWPLTLGFFISAVVQTVVSKRSMTKSLGGDSPKEITIAALFGMASSSCSYAAVALARSIFKKGASFVASMAFEIASTNLVIELGIILLLILGWQFALAEYLGGALMIIAVAVIMKLTLSRKLVKEAQLNLGKNLMGKMEGHAQMDMSLEKGTFIEKATSTMGMTAISHYFVMDWLSVWQDLVLGFLIAGALAVWVPQSFWQSFFQAGNPSLAKIEGPLIGPLVAAISFVCSVGNIPLAAVLWKGGISFGGVVSFIFADLIILPILDIYRKYYGLKVMTYIFLTFYVAMVAAGYIVEILFSFFNLIPTDRMVDFINEPITLNYTFILNLIFLALAAALVYRFLKTNGMAMVKMMNMPMQHEPHHH